ncbi:hypothetical protein BT93_D0186 [Corymbia citriodora subsp. variegata]|nr:hypothetical protein BT93_D0186 [Corymbia citriodora subsp. variegata]
MENKRQKRVKGVSFRVEGRESFLNPRPEETNTPLKAPQIFTPRKGETMGKSRRRGRDILVMRKANDFAAAASSAEKGLSDSEIFRNFQKFVWIL